jgi:ryanodine receptor 2
MEAVYIPEEDRCTDILSLVEDEDNLKYVFIVFLFLLISFKRIFSFCSNAFRLYNAICAQGNNRASHEICKFVDEKQLMYCVKNACKFILFIYPVLFLLNVFGLDLCGPIRIGIHNLLIALHFEPHIKAR